MLIDGFVIRPEIMLPLRLRAMLVRLHVIPSIHSHHAEFDVALFCIDLSALHGCDDVM